MIQQIQANAWHVSDFGWLHARWLFPDYPPCKTEHPHFGALRALMDGIILPGKGFPRHPHRDMEIITVVLSGALSQLDNFGNCRRLQAGQVQRLSAGTGIHHSEFNADARPVHFYEIWFQPAARSLKPDYEQSDFPMEAVEYCCLPVASGQGLPGVVTVHSAATVYLTDLEAGFSVVIDPDEAHQTFFYVGSGKVNVESNRLDVADWCRTKSEGKQMLKSLYDSGILLISVP